MVEGMGPSMHISNNVSRKGIVGLDDDRRSVLPSSCVWPRSIGPSFQRQTSNNPHIGSRNCAELGQRISHNWATSEETSKLCLGYVVRKGSVLASPTSSISKYADSWVKGLWEALSEDEVPYFDVVGKLEAATAYLFKVAENGGQAALTLADSYPRSAQGKRYRTADLDEFISLIQSDLCMMKETMHSMFVLEKKDDDNKEGVVVELTGSTHDGDDESTAEDRRGKTPDSFHS